MKNMRLRPKLDKISESSSPQHNTFEVTSPLRTVKNRVILGGMGDSYLSFFKLQNQNDTKITKNTLEVPTKDVAKESIQKKDQEIQRLQQSIMTEQMRKNAREKCFHERINTNWSNDIQLFFLKIVKSCLQMSRDNKKSQQVLLKTIISCCNQKNSNKKKVLSILSWILQWLQPVLRMFHQAIKVKYT